MSFLGLESQINKLEKYLLNYLKGTNERISRTEDHLSKRVGELENDVKELKNSLKVTKNTDNKNPRATKYAENVKHDVMVKQLKWAKNEEY